MIIELGYSDDPETKEMSEDVRGKVDSAYYKNVNSYFYAFSKSH